MHLILIFLDSVGSTLSDACLKSQSHTHSDFWYKGYRLWYQDQTLKFNIKSTNHAMHLILIFLDSVGSTLSDPCLKSQSHTHSDFWYKGYRLWYQDQTLKFNIKSTNHAMHLILIFLDSVGSTLSDPCLKSQSHTHSDFWYKGYRLWYQDQTLKFNIKSTNHAMHLILIFLDSVGSTLSDACLKSQSHTHSDFWYKGYRLWYQDQTLKFNIKSTNHAMHLILIFLDSVGSTLSDACLKSQSHTHSDFWYKGYRLWYQDQTLKFNIKSTNHAMHLILIFLDSVGSTLSDACLKSQSHTHSRFLIQSL